ncbi:MAG: YidC/Oxa1 family membrane protein insertase [Candidatus Kerfeldbacteria bacterium]
MFEFLYYDLLYEPLYNALIFLYTISPGKDMGMAVIFLTLAIRLMLLPFSIRGARSEYRLDRIRPQIEKLTKKYKHNIQKQRDAIKELLSKNKIGVFSNFFSLLFQLFFLIVLYSIFSSGLQPIGHNILYVFNLDPGVIDPSFFNWFNLIVPNQTASLICAAVVFLQQALKRAKGIGSASAIDKALLFGLPIGTYLATIVLPSGKAVFLTTSVLFSLWIKLIKWIVMKYMVKDEELKENVQNLWTN